MNRRGVKGKIRGTALVLAVALFCGTWVAVPLAQGADKWERGDLPEAGEILTELPRDADLPEEPGSAPQGEPGDEPPAEGKDTPQAEEGEEARQDEENMPVILGESAETSGWDDWYDRWARESSEEAAEAESQTARVLALPRAAGENAVQIKKTGGEAAGEDGAVTLSKKILATELENVFDIQLTVETGEDISSVLKDPDMAVVMVMDISYTMKSDFGTSNRYEAAVKASEQFLREFAKNAGTRSRIGYVAFNTDSYAVFPMQECSNDAQAETLIRTLKTQTGTRLNSMTEDDHKRFTNMEAGLKQATDLLAACANPNKYIVFLSDGFPTTYISEGYVGYDPYCADRGSGAERVPGLFRDDVTGVYCTLGTSYSDIAAIRAHEAAEEAKAQDVKIFTVGVDVGGQTIQEHLDHSTTSYSLVDRTEASYEIGDANSTESYKTWLRDAIGSGYYYDSTDTTGLVNAFAEILGKIQADSDQRNQSAWVVNDFMPKVEAGQYIEFIGFYDESGMLQTGLSGAGEANTAEFDATEQKIGWDLKQSRWAGNEEKKCYQMIYRVRLQNEIDGFDESTIYNTNGETKLSYRVSEEKNGIVTISELRELEVESPAVEGYLAEWSFRKQDQFCDAVAGAKFTLSHDSSCRLCHGDETAVTGITTRSATSGEDGTVRFTAIPSGHRYRLEEKEIPAGFAEAEAGEASYLVSVGYGEITVDGWESGDFTVVNRRMSVLPETGGDGGVIFLSLGTVLCVGAALLGRRRRAR